MLALEVWFCTLFVTVFYGYWLQRLWADIRSTWICVWNLIIVVVQPGKRNWIICSFYSNYCRLQIIYCSMFIFSFKYIYSINIYNINTNVFILSKVLWYLFHCYNRQKTSIFKSSQCCELYYSDQIYYSFKHTVVIDTSPVTTRCRIIHMFKII